MPIGYRKLYNQLIVSLNDLLMATQLVRFQKR